jgi:hypothetical protein
MRGAAALGWCVGLSIILASVSAGAAPVQAPPSFVNDQQGGVMPSRGQDPDFVIDPDSPDGVLRAKYNGHSDRDDKGDIAIYQGQDDDVPS